MTRLLAIETSGAVCSAAVSVDGMLTSSIEILRSNVHDEMLAGVVASACEHAGIPVSDIDIVAVSSGPGSFTGLRIGASFAKGLCYTGTPKLLAVPSHVAMMAAALEVARLSGASGIACAIGSHRDLVYLSTSPCDELDIEADAVLMTTDEARARIDAASMLVVGPAAGLLTALPVSGLSRHSARFVAYAAWIMLAKASPFADANQFVPNYHQEFQPR
jgi:tRNA threonylcarbamoyladenosine biosynthesis protein TsaB